MINLERRLTSRRKAIEQKLKLLYKGNLKDSLFSFYFLSEALYLLGYSSNDLFLEKLLTKEIAIELTRPEIALAEVFANELMERREKGKVVMESRLDPKKHYYVDGSTFACTNKITLTRRVADQDITLTFLNSNIVNNNSTNETLNFYPDRPAIIVSSLDQ